MSVFALVGDYFALLGDRFGRAWNEFWFAAVDPLVLSVVRLLTGMLACYTLLTYTPDLETFFGPEGLLPLENVEALRENVFTFSYLNYLSTPQDLWVGHWVGLAVVAMFTVGLLSRVTSVLALVVVLSYIHRGFLLTGQMEPILALLMFYLCLGPCGAYLSLDRALADRRARRAAPPAAASAVRRVPASWGANVALRLIQIHIALVCVMMVLGQLNENNWWDGTAVWWLAGRRESALVDLTWLYQYPLLVNAWTHSIVLFEGLFAVAAWNRLAAPLLVAVGVVVWGLLGVVSGLVPFTLAMIIGSLAFLPPASLRAALSCCGLRSVLE